MDGEAWKAVVHGVAEGRTWLSDFTFTFPLSCTGEGNGNPLQCSCLENPRDGGAWWAAVSGVTQSRTRLKWLSSSSSRWHSGKESTCKCRKCGFNPCSRNTPWRNKWQPTPVFLSVNPHGQRNPAGYSPWSRKELDTTEWLTHTHTHTISSSNFPFVKWGYNETQELDN